MLRIARFVMNCRAPASRRRDYLTAAAIAREQIAQELGAFLGPSLSRQPGVVRIRRLHVRLIVKGSMDRNRLIEAWLRAFSRQLFTALAYPAGGGHFQIHREPSSAHFSARLIQDVLSGTAAGKWEYRRDLPLAGLSRADAVITVLRKDKRDIPAVFDALLDLGALEPVLAVLDELSLEEVFRAIASSGATDDVPLDSSTLGLIAPILKRHPLLRSFRIDGRSQALRMFVLACREGVRIGPRVWLAALTVLLELSQNGEFWSDSPREAEQICGRPIPPAAITLLNDLRSRRVDQPDVLEALHAAGLPRPEPAQANEPWIELERASLLLLTGPLLRLGWHLKWRASPRDLQCLLYGVASSAAGAFDPALPHLNRNAAVFAGIFGEPALAFMRQFFQTSDLTSALPAVADDAIARFTARIPGFRKAPRDAVTRQFLTTPGRVRVENRRVVAVLAPNPLFVALHIGSLDEAIDDVPWFQYRLLEFRIEGL